MKFLPPYTDATLRKMSLADKPKGLAGLTTVEALAKQEVKSERDLHRQIVGWLRSAKGVRCVNESDMRRKTGRPIGEADLTFAYRGIPFALEIKLPGKNPTIDQLRWGVDAKHDGWKYAVVRSLVEAKEFFESSTQTGGAGSLYDVLKALGK